MNRKHKILCQFFLVLIVLSVFIISSKPVLAASTDKSKKPEGAVESYTISIEDAVLEGNVKLNKDGEKEYLSGLIDENDSMIFKLDIKDAYYFDAKIMASGIGAEQTAYVFLDGEQLGGFTSKTIDEASECIFRYIYLSEGEHDLKITRYSGDMKIFSIELNMRAEAYNMNQKVSTLSTAVMGISVLLLLVIIILFYVWIKHAYPEGKKGAFAGMACYFVICSCLLGMLYSGENAISAEVTSVPLQHVLQMFYIMAECAILVVCLYFAFTRVFFQPKSYNYGNILMFSLGFALVDSLSWMIRTGLNWLYCTTINSMGLGAFVRSVNTEEEIDTFMENISTLLDYGPVYYMFMFVERLLFISFVVAVMTLLYTVFTGKNKMNFLVKIWAVYVFYYFPTILREFGVIKSDVILFGLISLCIVAIIFIAYKVFVKAMPEDWNKYREIQKKGIYVVLFGRDDARRYVKGSISKNAGKSSKE